MSTVVNHLTEADTSKFENNSILLWFVQTLRKIQGKSLLQEEVLNKVVEQLKTNENLLGILLFGSLATGTHTWKSDIDLIFVYETHEPAAGLDNRFVDSIAVQYFFTTLETLIYNQESVPFLLHMFSEATILFDRYSSVAPVIHQLQRYFAAHPEVVEEWTCFKQLHQEEKNGPACAQTTIIQRWDELENKYSAGARKRTFFKFS
jgi:predicted nucleotidyltransferase